MNWPKHTRCKRSMIWSTRPHERHLAPSRPLVAGREKRPRVEVETMSAAAFHKIKRGLLEALDIAQAGDEEIADRLTREQAAQDAIRDRIAAQGQKEGRDGDEHNDA